MFAAFGLAIFITFKPQKAKTFAVPYALLEGRYLAVFYAHVPKRAGHGDVCDICDGSGDAGAIPLRAGKGH